MKDSKNTTKIAGVPFNTTGLIVSAIPVLLFINSLVINWITDKQQVIDILMG